MALSAIQAIFKTVKVVVFFKDLFANNARDVITLADIDRMITAQNATFFVTVQVAELRGIRREFYDAWLPSVASRNTISSADVVDNGSLYFVFQHLLRAIPQVKTGLDKLGAVFQTYSQHLHIDDHLHGVLVFMEMYALLIHMHSTYATLRRIQINADSLDDSKLLPDTLSVLVYLRDADRMIAWMDTRTRDRRRDIIGQVERHRNPGGVVNPPSTSFSYRDPFEPLPTTPSSNHLTVSNPPAHYRKTAGRDEKETRRQVEEVLAQRHRAVQERYGQVAGNDAREMLKSLKETITDMEHRRRLQGGRTVNAVIGAMDAGTDDLAKNDLAEDPSAAPFKASDVFDIPEGIDAYLALRDQLADLAGGANSEA